MDPGDAIFFHANLLHCSDMNRSDNPRWSMICCYNAAQHDPYKESHHPRYTPLAIVLDVRLKEVGRSHFPQGLADVAWLADGKDRSAQLLKKAP